MVAAAWCGVAALALAGCAGSDGGKKAPVPGSFEVRGMSAEASVSALPAGAECAQTPLALDASGWVCDDATSTGYLVEPASLSATDVAAVSAGSSEQPGSTTWGVRVTFTDTGATKFQEVTRKAAEKTPPANKVVMIVDGKVVLAGAVREAITGGELSIPLKGGEAEAQALATAIGGTPGTQ
jgi:preprotein translocase subunit SecD